MKIVLILVVLNAWSGSEVITANFEDVTACEKAARRTLQGVQNQITLSELEPDGAIIAGTVVATDENGELVGVFSCSATSTPKDG